MGVTHRDLKPENILLTKAVEGIPVQVKIADFGLAKMVHAETMLTSMVGTPQYLAPEVVMQSPNQPGYINVVDSWSVGIIVYSMMTKALPFDEDGNLPVEQRIKARYTQPADTELLVRLGISDLAIDFISGLLAKDPKQRMDMEQALAHEWLAGPSSQIAASQLPPSQVLGGDSQWGIQRFESEFPFDQGFDPSSDDNEKINGESAGEQDEIGRWSRPMTASGTNYESLGEFNSEESFSQPMNNLHLNTPSNAKTGIMQTTEVSKVHIPSSPPLSSSSIGAALEVDLQDHQQQQQASSQEEKENSDKNRKEAEDIHIDGGLPTPITPNPNPNPASNVKDVDVSMNGNGTAILMSKRKKQDEGFSSGSLSPPPNQAQSDAGDINLDRETNETTSRIKAKSTSPPNSKTMPTRQSTRTTRARKSMRLA
ncbi:uncharacterized protein L201_000520 [Kwoniella dendrophila CBS 6074]|uniref:non-specific serine/threonine protein kinase n=1 Tax=Kwoniella dendrophila CBS 6074 TaxID=1295534 RepID=A0AAX4JLB1_9TREE